MHISGKTVAIIGLGYVGLPLAVEFGRTRRVIGFDINQSRIDELRNGRDNTLEVDADELGSAQHLSFSHDPQDLEDAEIFIITVPTPVDSANRPNLSALQMASELVGKSMSAGNIVVYESTVFPGCTRQFCVPILEHTSGLTFNEEFFVGYSPERINPGDKLHRLPDILKVTSGSTPAAADFIDELYGSIIRAGTHKATSIEVAEAAKVIENTQRDLNIALMNELAIIFDRIGIDTHDVLAAAATKWNFLPFTPGLVGGHCIGVDPYYLTHRAQETGYHPEVILAGRRINDGMGNYVAHQVAKLMMRKGFPVVGSNVLLLGISFKEDCADLRNSKVVDVINGLKEFNANIEIYDPWVCPKNAEHEYGITLLAELPDQPDRYDAVVLAVPHQQFKKMGAETIRRLGKSNAVFYDIKGLFEKNESDGRL